MPKRVTDILVRIYRRHLEDERRRTNREYLTSRGFTDRNALRIHRFSRLNERANIILSIPFSLMLSGWILETDGSGLSFGFPTGPEIFFVTSCFAIFIIGSIIYGASASRRFGWIARYGLESAMLISTIYASANDSPGKRDNRANAQFRKEYTEALYRASWRIYAANKALLGYSYSRNDRAIEYTPRLLQWHGNNPFNSRSREHALDACLEQLYELTGSGRHVLPPRPVPPDTPSFRKKSNIRLPIFTLAASSLQAPLGVAIVTVVLSALARTYF